MRRCGESIIRPGITGQPRRGRHQAASQKQRPNCVHWQIHASLPGAIAHEHPHHAGGNTDIPNRRTERCNTGPFKFHAAHPREHPQGDAQRRIAAKPKEHGHPGGRSPVAIGKERTIGQQAGHVEIKGGQHPEGRSRHQPQQRTAKEQQRKDSCLQYAWVKGSYAL